MPLAGVLGDIVPYEVQIVFAFGCRMIAVGGFFLLKSPFGITSYLTVMMILIGTNIEIVTINSLYAKKLSKDVRGAMNGMINSVSAMGNLAFSQLAILLMKEQGVNAPFWVICVCDTITIMMAVCLSLSGHFDKENVVPPKDPEQIKFEREREAEEKIEEEIQRHQLKLLKAEADALEAQLDYELKDMYDFSKKKK